MIQCSPAMSKKNSIIKIEINFEIVFVLFFVHFEPQKKF